ncbi:MAG TPA: thioesterase domain-containing protein [Chitinophagaceae bacterium]|nr:thioesterase domain-containing protein [Chitinophagaceae bacterium]
MLPEPNKENALHAWKRILKIDEGSDAETSGVEDHSLIVLKVANRLVRLGYHINDKDLVQYQKIEQQSKFLETSLKLLNAAKEARFLIPLHTTGKNFTVFAFPDLLLYCNIGYHIKALQPFYTIEKSCFEKDEEIVNHYLAEIKAVKPKGPYGIIGYCRWGSVAVELAHRLLEEGNEVPVLVLIEYYSDGVLIPRTSKRFIGPKLKFFFDNLGQSKGYQAKTKYVITECFYGIRYLYGWSKSLFRKPVNVDVKTYPGKVVLIRASETYGVKDDPFMGWKESFTGEVESYKVQGEHLDIMLEPSAAQIARILNDVLERENKKLKNHSVVDFRVPARGMKQRENVL